MKTITGTTCAWLNEYSAARNSSVEIQNMSFAEQDMTSFGWVKIGTAEISVELFDDKEIFVNKLAVLDEAEKRVKADAENKLTEIERQRQQLLAIEHKA